MTQHSCKQSGGGRLWVDLFDFQFGSFYSLLRLKWEKGPTDRCPDWLIHEHIKRDTSSEQDESVFERPLKCMRIRRSWRRLRNSLMVREEQVMQWSGTEAVGGKSPKLDIRGNRTFKRRGKKGKSKAGPIRSCCACEPDGTLIMTAWSHLQNKRIFSERKKKWLMTIVGFFMNVQLKTTSWSKYDNFGIRTQMMCEMFREEVRMILDCLSPDTKQFSTHIWLQ